VLTLALKPLLEGASSMTEAVEEIAAVESARLGQCLGVPSAASFSVGHDVDLVRLPLRDRRCGASGARRTARRAGARSAKSACASSDGLLVGQVTPRRLASLCAEIDARNTARGTLQAPGFLSADLDVPPDATRKPTRTARDDDGHICKESRGVRGL